MSNTINCDKKFICLLSLLANEKIFVPDSTTITKPDSFNTCYPINTITSTEYNVPYRNTLMLCRLNSIYNTSLFPSDNSSNSLGLSIGLDILYNQKWNLIELSVSDISSNITLAPNETLTLEFENSQRKTLEQSTVDYIENITSDESLINDKEIINVMRSSTKNSSWNVGGNASFSIGSIFSFGGGGDVKNSLIESSEDSMENINETTRKSANNLKLVHKVEVKGTSETVIKNRMQRIIKNPYTDRTLSLNVLQLMKNYSIETSVKEIRPSLVIDISNINFDSSFIQKNSNFLRQSLLDPDLVLEIDPAIEAITRLNLNVPKEAILNARLALEYVFGSSNDNRNIFNVVNPDGEKENVNYVKTSYDGGYPKPPNNNIMNNPGIFKVFEYGDAYLSQIYTIFNFFFKVYQMDMTNNFTKTISDEDAVMLIASLASKEVQDLWQKIDSKVLVEILRTINYSVHLEIIRRIPGFFTMINHMVKPYIPDLELNSTFSQPYNYNLINNDNNQIDPKSIPSTSTEELKYYKNYYNETQNKNISNSTSLNTIIKHLNYNKNYYIQKFIKYMSDNSHNYYSIHLAKEVINNIITGSNPDTGNDEVVNLTLSVFDTQQTFINKQQLVIPAYKNLSEKTISKILKLISASDENFDCDKFLNEDSDEDPDFKFSEITPKILNISLPTDGVHLEASAGNCIMDKI